MNHAPEKTSPAHLFADKQGIEQFPARTFFRGKAGLDVFAAVCYDKLQKGCGSMKIIKHYREDAALRASFNALAEATFGLNFENWYCMGYWTDNYSPYSLVEDGQVVANVSVNRTDMVIGGQRRRLYQLGTVMTAENCRNRGYIRTIMEEVEKDIADADGVYLFANDSVVDFYPKFGFREEKEYVYGKTVEQTGACRMKRIPMDSPENRNRLAQAMKENTFPTGCRMVENPGLIFFYAAQFMQECVYYDETLDAWAIAEWEDGELLLHEVFASEAVSLEEVIAAFGPDVKQVALGFAPADPADFACEEYHEEDCTFFVKGEVFREFGEKKLRIPSLAHA